MAKRAVSWVLVGVFAYLWWWAGRRLEAANVEDNAWGSIYTLFTIISLAVLTRSARTAAAGMFSGLVGTVRGFLPNLLWLAAAIIVLRAVAWLHVGITDPVDNFIRAVVSVVAAGFTTMLWYGAVVNATEDS